MGQKANAIGLRLGVNKSWESRWFAEKNYAKLLQEDLMLRKFLLKKLSLAGVSKILIERPGNRTKTKIHFRLEMVVLSRMHRVAATFFTKLKNRFRILNLRRKS